MTGEISTSIFTGSNITNGFLKIENEIIEVEENNLPLTIEIIRKNFLFHKAMEIGDIDRMLRYIYLDTSEEKNIFSFQGELASVRGDSRKEYPLEVLNSILSNNNLQNTQVQQNILAKYLEWEEFINIVDFHNRKEEISDDSLTCLQELIDVARESRKKQEDREEEQIPTETTEELQERITNEIMKELRRIANLQKEEDKEINQELISEIRNIDDEDNSIKQDIFGILKQKTNSDELDSFFSKLLGLSGEHEYGAKTIINDDEFEAIRGFINSKNTEKKSETIDEPSYPEVPIVKYSDKYYARIMDNIFPIPHGITQYMNSQDELDDGIYIEVEAVTIQGDTYYRARGNEKFIVSRNERLTFTNTNFKPEVIESQTATLTYSDLFDSYLSDSRSGNSPSSSPLSEENSDGSDIENDNKDESYSLQPESPIGVSNDEVLDETNSSTTPKLGTLGGMDAELFTSIDRLGEGFSTATPEKTTPTPETIERDSVIIDGSPTPILESTVESTMPGSEELMTTKPVEERVDSGPVEEGPVEENKISEVSTEPEEAEEEIQETTLYNIAHNFDDLLDKETPENPKLYRVKDYAEASEENQIKDINGNKVEFAYVSKSNEGARKLSLVSDEIKKEIQNGEKSHDDAGSKNVPGIKFEKNGDTIKIDSNLKEGSIIRVNINNGRTIGLVNDPKGKGFIILNNIKEIQDEGRGFGKAQEITDEDLQALSKVNLNLNFNNLGKQLTIPGTELAKEFQELRSSNEEFKVSNAGQLNNEIVSPLFESMNKENPTTILIKGEVDKTDTPSKPNKKGRFVDMASKENTNTTLGIAAMG